MTLSAISSVVLIDLVASVMVKQSDANGKVLLYANDDFDDVDSAITLSTGPAQRYYSLRCEAFKPSFAIWSNVQMQSKIAFFKDDECRGKYKTGRGECGFIVFKDTEFDKMVSSIMIWESGVFNTRGHLTPCGGERSAVGNESLLFEDAFDFDFNLSYTGEYGDTDTWDSLDDGVATVID